MNHPKRTHPAASDQRLRTQLVTAKSLLTLSAADSGLAQDIDALLDCGEMESTVNALDDLAETLTAPEAFWSLLVDSAETLGLAARAQTFRWKRIEARNGYLRATLRIFESMYQVTVTSGFRACWDIGQRAGEATALADGAITIEDSATVDSGEARTVRIHPLVPTLWRHVRHDTELSMLEAGRLLGAAVVLDVVPPFARRR